MLVFRRYVSQSVVIGDQLLVVSLLGIGSSILHEDEKHADHVWIGLKYPDSENVRAERIPLGESFTCYVPQVGDLTIDLPRISSWRSAQIGFTLEHHTSIHRAEVYYAITGRKVG